MLCTSVSHQNRGRHYPPHSHGEYQMIFVSAGEVKLECAGQSWHVCAPAILLLGNLETHSFSRITEEYDRYSVTIAPDAAVGIMEERLLRVFLPHGEDRSPVVTLQEAVAAEMRMLFAALEEESAQTDFPDAADTLVRMILLRLYRYAPQFFPPRSESDSLTEQVRRVLETHLEEKMSLHALGERFHISVYHLERLFRAYTGYSIGRYRLLCRVAAARELLATTDLPVGEIAARVGIGDMSNFSRYFKRETGQSPQQYRRAHRG